MASLIYDSFLDDVSKNNVSEADTFYLMLVTSSYSPAKGTDAKRSDVTNEIVGTGYIAGGAASAMTPALDTSGNKKTWTFASVSWAASTITNARAGVLYKHRGGASSADNLVAYVDFGGNISDVAGTFTVTFTAPLTFQN